MIAPYFFCRTHCFLWVFWQTNLNAELWYIVKLIHHKWNTLQLKVCGLSVPSVGLQPAKAPTHIVSKYLLTRFSATFCFRAFLKFQPFCKITVFLFLLEISPAHTEVLYFDGQYKVCCNYWICLLSNHYHSLQTHKVSCFGSCWKKRLTLCLVYYGYRIFLVVELLLTKTSQHCVQTQKPSTIIARIKKRT